MLNTLVRIIASLPTRCYPHTWWQWVIGLSVPVTGAIWIWAYNRLHR